MSRLVDDPSRVGPGSYQLIEDQTKRSPKNTISWNRERTVRKSEIVSPLNKTGGTVGPGSYQTQSQFYRPQMPFFARDGMKPVKVSKNRGSIKNNFEMMGGDSDEEDDLVFRKQSPGPGAY